MPSTTPTPTPTSAASDAAATLLATAFITDIEPWLRWPLALIAGGGVAGVVQVATVATRAVSGVTTLGLGNPIVATGELAGSTAFTISNFVVPDADAGNASVSPDPAAATQGVPLDLTASWSGLDAAMRWFGLIRYAGASNVTLFSVG